MATLYTHQSENVTKTWFFIAFLFIVVIAVGWFLSYYYGDPNILYIAVIFSVFSNFFSYWFSDKVALSLSGAKPADEAEYRELHRILENLSITAGLPKPRLYIINDPAPNAFATGRNPQNSAVAVTTGLIERLDKVELEGVLAHELSHIGNRDILIATIAVIMVGLLSIASDMFIRGSIFGRGSGSDKRGGNPLFLLIGLILVLLAPILGTLIRLAVSRKREFLADATGALITRYPEGLANALRKISTYEFPLRKASDATAHLYISNPFGSRAKKGLHALFLTHPPVEDRIKALLNESK